MLRPTGKRILVRPEPKPEENRTAGGLYIPEKQWSMQVDVVVATVLAIGPKVISDIKVNRKVLISRLAGVKVDGDIIIDEEDIAAVVEE